MTTLARPHLDGAAEIIWRLEDRLRTAHGENLALRAVLAEHGIDEPAPEGVVTLTRLRRLEDVMDLAREFLCDPSDDKRTALWEAIGTAGRAP